MLQYIGVIFLLGFVAYLLFNNRNMKTYSHYMKRMRNLEESIKDFGATETYSNQNMAIAINDEEEMFYISTMKDGTPVPYIYEYKDIIGSEIMEDGVIVEATWRSGHLGAGISSEIPTGVIPPKSSVISNLFTPEGTKISRIDLKISFDDVQNPYVLANFIYWGVIKDSDDYHKASEIALHWHGIIDNIINGESTQQNRS